MTPINRVSTSTASVAGPARDSSQYHDALQSECCDLNRRSGPAGKFLGVVWKLNFGFQIKFLRSPVIVISWLTFAPSGPD